MIDSIVIRHGKWQDVLADVAECDSLITDPPYSERSARGYRTGNSPSDTRGIAYGSITEDDAIELAQFWAPRVRRWVAIFGDHISFRWHEAAWQHEGWYTFADVPWIKNGCAPRLGGDGPASQCDHIMIARRRGLKPDGHRRGWYIAETPRHGHGGMGVTGNKDPLVMRALVRDYSRRGDLVVDPYAGSGTTALACALEGRSCITAECDRATFDIAHRRLSCYTPDLPFMCDE